MVARPRAVTDDDTGVEIGSMLGSYRLLSVLGRGGMGEVYKAEHVRLGRKVALKLLRPEFTTRKEALQRFFQEARVVNKIRHRNIVDVTDLVEENGRVFIIMELVDGVTLGGLARQGALSPARLLPILVQVCDALEAVHKVGVVHRDLKPDNILICSGEDGGDRAKLLDFGIAKLSDPDDPYAMQTSVGCVLGTLTYMSPEQASGGDVDARSDIYSIGAIMYRLYCGVAPFAASSLRELITNHLKQSLILPSQTIRGVGVDRPTEKVIVRCLKKDPEQRFPTVSDLGSELSSLPGKVNSSGETETLLLDDVVPSLVLTTPPGTSTRRWVWAAPALVVVAGLVWFGSRFASGGDADDKAPAPSVITVITPPDEDKADKIPHFTIVLDIQPPHARVELDGLVTSERKLTLPKSKDKRRLKVTAPGYSPRGQEFRVTSDGKVEVRLKKKIWRPREMGGRRDKRVKGPLETEL